MQDSTTTVTAACPKCGLRLDASVPVCPNDGTHVVPEFANDPVFENNYEFCERIAAGGMGVIYKARHRALDMFVAIKMLMTTATPTIVQRFQQEAKTLAKFQHPNLVRLFELGVTTYGQPYTVMEFVDGKGLDRVLAERGRLMIPQAMNIVMQACDGLQYVHERGITHRDLKPSNIMLVDPQADKPLVKLVDFGVAKFIDDESAKALTQTGEVIGSPLYMSPEQAKGSFVDTRADIYSLGCVLYEMLTGVPPFSARTAVELIVKQVSEKQKPLNSMVSGGRFPNAVETLVQKMMEKEPTERFQTMQEVKDTIDSMIDQHQAWYHIEMPGGSFKDKNMPTWPFMIAVTVVILALLGVVAHYGVSNYYTATAKKLSSDRFVNVDAREDRLPVLSDDDDAARTSIIDSKDTWVNRPAPLSLPADALTWFARRHQRYVDDLNFNGQRNVTDESLRYITGFPLTRLHLKKTGITREALGSICQIGTLQNLELEGVKLRAVDVKQLAKLHWLTELTLISCHLNDDCLKELKNLRMLTHLNLMDNLGISSNGVGYLADLPLLSLDLTHTRIDDAAGPTFAKMTGVTRLVLNASRVTDKIFPYLQKMNNLHAIALDVTAISDKGLNAFEPKHLDNLLVSGCDDVTRAGLHNFLVRHPACFVVHGRTR